MERERSIKREKEKNSFIWRVVWSKRKKHTTHRTFWPFYPKTMPLTMSHSNPPWPTELCRDYQRIPSATRKPRLGTRIDSVQITYPSLGGMWTRQVFFILTDPKFLYPQNMSYCTRGKIVKCIRDKALQLGCQDSARWPWASYSISQIYKNKMILIFCKPFLSFICKVGTITLPISSFWQWIKWLKCIEQCLVHCNWSININYHYYYY